MRSSVHWWTTHGIWTRLCGVGRSGGWCVLELSLYENYMLQTNQNPVFPFHKICFERTSRYAWRDMRVAAMEDWTSMSMDTVTFKILFKNNIACSLLGVGGRVVGSENMHSVVRWMHERGSVYLRHSIACYAHLNQNWCIFVAKLTCKRLSIHATRELLKNTFLEVPPLLLQSISQ